MDLKCTPRVTIQWIVTIQFFFYGLAGFLFWPFPDRKGRKTTMALFGSLHIMAQWVLLLWPNYFARLIAFAAIGMC